MDIFLRNSLTVLDIADDFMVLQKIAEYGYSIISRQSSVREKGPARRFATEQAVKQQKKVPYSKTVRSESREKWKAMHRDCREQV
jgi:hypothetical protein